MSASIPPFPALASRSVPRGFEVKSVQGGWIVGAFNDKGEFEKILPHGEPTPYSTQEMARQALNLLSMIA